MIKFFKKIKPGVLYVITLAIILYISLSSNPLNVRGFEWYYGSDKIIHAVMWGFLTMVMAYEVSKALYFFDPGWELYICMFLINSLLSVLVELVQELMKIGRHFDIYDIVANCAGVLVCGLVMKFILMDWIAEKMDSIDDY
jgi:glycopeptide antibiotics resistance protein